MANKTKKKNNVAIEWPTNTHFTIEDLFTKYPDFVQITLRFRVKRGLEQNDIVAIGKIKPSIGRPRLVYSTVNPTKEVLENAKKAGVLPLDTDTKRVSINVAEVTTPTNNSVETNTAETISQPSNQTVTA